MRQHRRGLGRYPRRQPLPHLSAHHHAPDRIPAGHQACLGLVGSPTCRKERGGGGKRWGRGGQRGRWLRRRGSTGLAADPGERSRVAGACRGWRVLPASVRSVRPGPRPAWSAGVSEGIARRAVTQSCCASARGLRATASHEPTIGDPSLPYCDGRALKMVGPGLGGWRSGTSPEPLMRGTLRSYSAPLRRLPCQARTESLRAVTMAAGAAV
jgi:hypothetical protein